MSTTSCALPVRYFGGKVEAPGYLLNERVVSVFTSIGELIALPRRYAEAGNGRDPSRTLRPWHLTPVDAPARPLDRRPSDEVRDALRYERRLNRDSAEGCTPPELCMTWNRRSVARTIARTTTHAAERAVVEIAAATPFGANVLPYLRAAGLI